MPDQFGLSNRINVTVQYYSAPSKITFHRTDILVCACGSASSRARAWEKWITRSQMAGERVNESKSSRNHLQQGTQRWKSQLSTSGFNGDQGRYGISLTWFLFGGLEFFILAYGRSPLEYNFRYFVYENGVQLIVGENDCSPSIAVSRKIIHRDTQPLDGRLKKQQ